MKSRLLLIDQDPSPVLVDYFQTKGFDIEKASDESTTLKKIVTEQFDCILFHLSEETPEKIGFIKDLYLRARMPCRIIVSGPNEVSTAVKAMHLGAHDYWPSPLTVETLEREFAKGTLSLSPRRFNYQREGTLLQVIKEIALTMELDGLVNILMDSAMELTQADGGALLMLDEKSNLLVARAIRGLSSANTNLAFFGMPEKTYYDILESKVPVFFDTFDQPVFTAKKQKLRAMIVAPISWKETPLCELVIVKVGEGHSFSPDDFKVLTLLSAEIAGAVYNAVTHYKTKELTIKDDLTEAYNRRYFEQYLEEEFSRARRYGSRLSLIFFDVDNLKDVNVKYGHLIGSKTLQEIAHRMILTVRGIDKVVRYGGDEFCVVLPETDIQGAVQVADRIRNTIADRPFRINESAQVSLTGSFGIASFPDHASTKDDLIRQADRAMFSIKNKNKNAIGVASQAGTAAGFRERP